MLMKTEEEIDAWYEDQKTTLLESFTTALSDEKTAKSAESTFHKSMQDLMSKYTEQMHKQIAWADVQKVKDKKKAATKAKREEQKAALLAKLPFKKKKQEEDEQ